MPAVRSLLFLTLLSACDLQPPPKGGTATPAAAPKVVAPAPAPAPAPTPAVAPAPAPAPPSVQGVQPAPAVDAISDECKAVGVHIADVLITSADATQRAVLEQDRAKLVLRTEQSCARNTWSAPKISCFNGAKSQADLDACNKLP